MNQLAARLTFDRSFASLRTFSVDDDEHFLHNLHASVASLRLLFTFVPERRSASLRNRCSPSPEYPETADDKKLQTWASEIAHIGTHNSYHVGQMIIVRKLQGSWNPEKGVK